MQNWQLRFKIKMDFGALVPKFSKLVYLLELFKDITIIFRIFSERRFRKNLFLDRFLWLILRVHEFGKGLREIHNGYEIQVLKIMNYGWFFRNSF